MRQGRCLPSHYLPGWAWPSPLFRLSAAFFVQHCTEKVSVQTWGRAAACPHAASQAEPGPPLSAVLVLFLLCAIAQKNVQWHRKMCNRSGVVYALSARQCSSKDFFKIPSLYNLLIKERNSILLAQLLILAFVLLIYLEKVDNKHQYGIRKYCYIKV